MQHNNWRCPKCQNREFLIFKIKNLPRLRAPSACTLRCIEPAPALWVMSWISSEIKKTTNKLVKLCRAASQVVQININFLE